MVATIQQESTVVHPQTRFVTAEAIAQLLGVHPEQLTQIRCWAHVILVVGDGISRFVSYADLPPIVAVEPPTTKDFLAWRKRWRKTRTYTAPQFWVEFYAQKFQQAGSLTQLHKWGELVSQINFGFNLPSVQSLQSIYQELTQQYSWQTSLT